MDSRPSSPQFADVRIARIATEMLEGRIPLLLGVRMIGDSFSGATNPDPEIVKFFNAIDSETDHLSLNEEARAYCSSEHLQEIDKIAQVLELHGQEILNACRQLSIRTMLPQYSRVKLISENYEGEGYAAGMIGYIIECYPDGKYEVEFSGDQGVTLAQIVAGDEDLILAPEMKK